MEKIEVQKERDKVDDYIITANIALIAAFIILLSIENNKNVYASAASAFSLFGIITSLLLSLWHKWRFPHRKHLFEIEKAKLIQNISQEMADFTTTFILPIYIQHTFKNGNQQLPQEKIDFKKAYDEAIDKEKTKQIFTTQLEKLNYQLKEAREKYFDKPLQERNARVKFALDKSAGFGRNKFFILGLFFFLISIILKITIRP